METAGLAAKNPMKMSLAQITWSMKIRLTVPEELEH
jgi:hypothetical protein